jgi:DNA-binding Xre family transcriptional regulator
MRKEWKNLEIPWRLATVMDARQIRTIAALRRLVAKRIPFSYDQARRLVTGDFAEMPSFAVLDALCAVLRCNPDDLIAIAHRDASPQFALSIPKAKKKWTPRKGLQPRHKLPRQGALTATALPVEIY